VPRRHFRDRYHGNLVWGEPWPRAYDERHVVGTGALIATALIGSSIGAAATITSGVLSTNAAKTAANDQLSYEEQALQVQNANTQAQLTFEKQQWAQQQANLQPYINASKATLGDLMNGLGINYNPNAPLPSAPTGGGTTAPGGVAQGQVVPLGSTIPTSPTPAPTSSGNVPIGSMYQAAPINRGAVAPTGAPPAGPQAMPTPNGPAPPPTQQIAPQVAAGGSGYGDQGGQPPPSAPVGVRARVEWPDQSTQDIDAADLQQYVALGATQVA
jgi:hypothetical protein